MELSQITPTGATTASPQVGDSASAITSDFETFLKMLTVQMENQDPLDPTDASEYAAQLATFSGVEQQVLTNDLLKSLMSQMNTTSMAQMADWVGREARAPMPVHFDGAPITVAPNPAAAADSVELAVFDSNGNEVERTAIPRSTDLIEWAGVQANGTPFDSGAYSFRVISRGANGEVLLNDLADVYAQVREVRSENGQSVLVMDGGVSILASDVGALRDG